MPDQLDEALTQLALAYGVATDYWDWKGVHVTVPAATIRTVLAALDVDASTPESAAAALAAREEARWRRMLPPVLVLREGRTPTFDVHVRAGAAVEVHVELETGETRGVRQWENWTPPRQVDGETRGEATYVVPGDLPSGYHTVHARSEERSATMELIVTPAWLGVPARLGERRAWGLATQLYQVTSAQSWGTGDLTDLADLGAWAATRHGADFVLINPLHAAEPVAPMEPSPYLPTSRRFANPLYLRPERIPEYAGLPAAEQRRVRGLQAKAATGEDRIDRDRAWRAKRAALELVHRVPLTAGRRLAYDAYREREGRGLVDYATWAAIAEEHGPRSPQWPVELGRPDLPGVAAYRESHPDLVDFHCWLQWQLDEQQGRVQADCRRAGMGLGVMADLAVGVSPTGADAWALQDTYATGITVGAPPDPFNQNGQNWSQPPWRPDRLADTGYAAFRAMVSTVLRNAGGIRVDHVIGLFRLWWIPAGELPTQGTYVRYDHEAMIGILALEAHRAGAVVVGEDLGVVEPWVRTYLAERGIAGTSILWFEFDHDGDGGPLPAQRWRELCLASVTTHDLPPTAGYLAFDHVRLRDELGLLTRSYDEELAADRAEQESWLDLLRARGELAPGADVQETVEALHRHLTRSPSRLRCVALTDAVGDRRTQNQPGTIDEYPNWRVPLTDADGAPVHLEDVFTSDRAAALAEIARG